MKPGYIDLFKSGELERRALSLEARLADCDICPRNCRVDRRHSKKGYCHSGYMPAVSSSCAHHGEEPAISGTRGSGAIFFANCNMRCVFCQNYQISQNWEKQDRNETDCHSLAEKMVSLQDERGCHNINLVSPSHVVPQIVRAVLEAVPMGLHMPIVYNTGGYDSLSTLRQLDGIVSIYLPDLRYASDDWSMRLSGAPNYVSVSRQAIKEMYRQAGDLQLDESGVALRGLIVRHLVMPNGVSGTGDSLTWLARAVSPTVTVSLMSQYLPVHKARTVPGISRPITVEEYEAALQLMDDLGLENGWVQDMSSPQHYVPDFERQGDPFLRVAGE